METKHKEVIFKTSNLEEIKGKYLAEKLLRGWKEDFVDEDTDEVVQIERNELILQKGVLIEDDELSQINFYLQSGDIDGVTVSNQGRFGSVVHGYVSVWQVTIKVTGEKKKRNYFLYAFSQSNATEIITDYLEQVVYNSFQFTCIKEVDYSNLIPVAEESTAEDFYKSVVEVIYDEQEPVEQTYIAQADDAEEAKELIVKFIAQQKKDENFETTIMSAQKISCSNIVPYQFSKVYFDELNKDNEKGN